VARERAQQEPFRGDSPAPRSPGGRFARREKSPKGEAALLDALLGRNYTCIYMYEYIYICIFLDTYMYIYIYIYI